MNNLQHALTQSPLHLSRPLLLFCNPIAARQALLFLELRRSSSLRESNKQYKEVINAPTQTNKSVNSKSRLSSTPPLCESVLASTIFGAFFPLTESAYGWSAHQSQTQAAHLGRFECFPIPCNASLSSTIKEKLRRSFDWSRGALLQSACSIKHAVKPRQVRRQPELPKSSTVFRSELHRDGCFDSLGGAKTSNRLTACGRLGMKSEIGWKGGSIGLFLCLKLSSPVKQ